MRIKIFPAMVAVVLAIVGGAAIGQNAGTIADDDQQLEAARALLTNKQYPEARELAVDFLRLVVLELPYEASEREKRLTEIRAKLQNGEDSSIVVPEWERAVAWVDDLRRGDPARIYEQAKMYRSRDDVIADLFPGFKDAAVAQLLMLADHLGHRPASFDLAQIYLDGNDLWPGGSKSLLRSLALENYLPAQIDLADRYFGGRGVAVDLARSYYWYLRARSNGGDVAAAIAQVEGRLPPEARARVTRLLAEGDVPLSILLD